MNQPTKQELRDRIATLEMCNVLADNDSKRLEGVVDYWQAQAKRATIAAYACLAVIFIMVGLEVIW